MSETANVGGPQGSPTPSTDLPEEKAPKAGNISMHDWPDRPRSEAAQVPATIENFAFLMKHYGIIMQFNAIKKRVDIVIPDTVVELQNRDSILLTKLESLAIRHRMSPGKVASYILALGGANTYDPFADWVLSKPWDGTSRLPDICETLTVAEGYSSAFANVLLLKWLLSIVAATFKGAGFRSRGVLTLQGGQGIGKTSWFAQLIGPPKLREDIVKLGHNMDNGNKDAKLVAIRHRIVELGELEGSFRKEIANLKAFLTENIDKIRPPYGRVEAEYRRSTIFGASVNDEQFLIDWTGNSRFWTIALKDIDYKHTIDMQQVFAELKAMFDQGEQWWLSPKEEQQLETVNNSYRVMGAIEAKLMERLDLSRIGDPKLKKLTGNQVLEAIGVKNPTNPQSKEVAGTLRRLLGPSKKCQGYHRWPIPWSLDPEPNGTEYFENEDTFGDE